MIRFTLRGFLKRVLAYHVVAGIMTGLVAGFIRRSPAAGLRDMATYWATVAVFLLAALMVIAVCGWWKAKRSAEPKRND